jgi:uncharacterized low-complexity protein
MKTSIAIIAACAGALVFAQTDLAKAQPKPGKQTRATGQIIVNDQDAGGKAAPGKPGQNRSAINTSRSNIKHQGSAAPEKPKPAGAAINTTRSNIKHGAQ